MSDVDHVRALLADTPVCAPPKVREFTDPSQWVELVISLDADTVAYLTLPKEGYIKLFLEE